MLLGRFIQAFWVPICRPSGSPLTTLRCVFANSHETFAQMLQSLAMFLRSQKLRLVLSRFIVRRKDMPSNYAVYALRSRNTSFVHGICRLTTVHAFRTGKTYYDHTPCPTCVHGLHIRLLCSVRCMVCGGWCMVCVLWCVLCGL